jgi:signal transduction histidine kinase
VLTPNGTDVVVTDVSKAQLRAGVARAWWVLGLLGGLMLVAALAVAEQIGRRISTPVTRVAEVADQLREGDLTARAELEGPAETQALAVALNRLGERITELLAMERAAVGDLSHRLRTPVTALRIDVDSVPDDDLAERMRHHVANLQRTIDAIVKDARRPVQHEMRSRCDAAAVVAERVAFWSVLAEDQRRALTRQLVDTPVPVGLDAEDLADVIDIVIDNVFAHTAEGTDFSVTARAVDDVAEIVVHDPGSEPPEQITEGRSGLGLQIARRTVAAAGGTLQFDQDPSHGTTVTIRLPVQSS